MTDQPLAFIPKHMRRSVAAWMHLIRIHLRVGGSHHALLSQHGLTPAQFFVLSSLNSEPGLSQQTLADRLSVTKGNVCGLIDRLEAAGLVERQPDPTDRRSHQVYATEAGIQAFQEAAPDLQAHVVDKFSVLTADEQATLLYLLAKLDRSLR
jgi:MarR family transcriptional regulator, organic hydroperoxide resistance regulator